MPTVTKQGASAPRNQTKPGSSGSKSAWDLSAGIKMLLYGVSGTGKTTFWASFPKPILALICSGGQQPGELRSIDTPENRKSIDARIVSSTDQIKGMIADAGNFATVVIDHASGLQDLTLKEILGLDELPAQKGWGMATMQQYGQSSLQCKELFRALLNLTGNVVIVAQERVFGGKEDGVPTDIIKPTVGAAMTPSVTGWLAPACDYVVQTYKRPKMVKTFVEVAGTKQEMLSRGKGVEYCLRTEPHDIYQSKFRILKGRVLPECIVDPDYAKIEKLIKGG